MYNSYSLMEENKFLEIKKNAENGDPKAQFELGAYYFNGVFVNQSYEQAVYWFTKAAEQDDSDGQTALGTCYYFGYGVKKSYEEAFNLFTLAANKGNILAQVKLALVYESGHGVEQSYEQAEYWFKKAAEKGHIDSQEALAIRYFFGEDWIEQSYEKSIFWANKAAEQGDPNAQYILGYCYEDGKGVEQSYEQAFYWYKKAAEQGNTLCECNLGVFYEEGTGVEQSYEQAEYWFKKAANQDDERGIWELAFLFFEKPDPDYKKAKTYIEKYISIAPKDTPFFTATMLSRLATYYTEFDKENGKVVNYFKAKELLEQSLEYYKKAGEEPDSDLIALLETVNHMLNIDDGNNNKMGFFAKDIIEKNIPVKDLFSEVEKVLKDKFKNLYELIKPYSVTCLTTALLAYISLANVGEENYDKLDFSSVISPMIKMCEIELGRVFHHGFMKYLKDNNIPATEFDPELQKFVVEKKNSVPPLVKLDNSELNQETVNTAEYDYYKRKKYNPDSVIKYIPDSQFGGFTLGGIQKYLNIRQINKPILGVGFTDKKGKSVSFTEKRIEMDVHLLDYFDLIFKDELFKGNNRRELIKKYLYRFSQKVKNIAFELRNPSSHTQVMPYWKAIYCGNILFMKDNFIVDFLSKVKPEYLISNED